MGSFLATSSANSDDRFLTRLLTAAAIVCVIGIGVSITIANVHAQIDSLGDRYTSFCNVNESINCDRVLASPYAKLAGIPVAHLAIVAYLAMAGLFLGAARSRTAPGRRRLLGLAAAGVTGSLVFSAYMAVVSGVLLKTVCLLCMSLYAVALVSAGLTFAAVRAAARREGVSAFPIGLCAGTLVASTAAVVGVALFTWPDSGGLSRKIVTLDDVREADPQFFAWYQSLPRGSVSNLVREDQAEVARSGKVVVVDFFDLECGHCKQNFFLLQDLKAKRGDGIEFVHRHFPLDATCNEVVPSSVHPNACRAAEAVECAGLQGKHDEMLQVLFENQGQLFAENLIRLGGRIGLDTAALERCLSQHTTLPKVLEDCRAGARLEITSTPTVYVGGRRIKGTLDNVSKYEMAVLIEQQADK